MTKICHARLVFWTLVSLLPALGTALVIDIKPEKLTESMKGNVDIKCRVDTCDVEQIISFGISKDNGPQLAYVKEDGHPSYDATKYHAVGSVNYDVRKSYLKLSILHPGQSDQGEYTCKLDFMNKRGYTQVRTVSSKLDVDDLDIRQMVLSMKKEISHLKAQILAQDKKEKELRSKMSGLEQKDNAIERSVAGLGQQVAAREAKDSVLSAFSASISHLIDSGFRGTIKFDKVMYMYGRGYSSSTGKFTAPVAGLYAFHISTATYCDDCHAYVHIFVRNEQKATIFVGAEDVNNQASTSTVVALKKGDVVEVRKDGSARLEDHPFTMFNGYLIKAF